MKKRILSILLSLCMVCMLLPTTALADDVDPAEHTHADWTRIETVPSGKVMKDNNEWIANAAGYYVLDSGNYYLGTRISLGNSIRIAENATVTLCLNGKTITGGSDKAAIIVATGATLNLTECNESTIGQITHETGQKGRGVEVKGTFHMYGGSITGNSTTTPYNATSKGGGVYVTGENAAFNMYGGSITGNTAAQDGGGVYVNNGTFNMSGGTIGGTATGEANTAQYGGGVYVVDSNPGTVPTCTFEMSSGSITGNQASEKGGGVFVGKRSTFTMTGGTIGGTGENGANTATKYGGGVAVVGTFNMSGDAAITGNKIDENNGIGGGGVYVSYEEASGYTVYGKFTMSGNASITGNTATLYGRGGGVYMTGKPDSNGTQTCTFTMTGGTIGGTSESDGNKANYGGGVSVLSGKFTMTGGSIAGNTAGIGGGVAMYAISGYNVPAPTFTMSGSASITGNKATSFYGGGVYVNGTNCQFIMEGGTIGGTGANDGNSAANRDGGGVYVVNGKFSMTDGSIAGNTANYGGGVAVYTNDATMSGGSITGNSSTKQGGGVYVGENGTFTMSGTAGIANNIGDTGSVTESERRGGGGVYVANGGTFDMTGGSITGNTAEGRYDNDTNYRGTGGGVLVDGAFTMSGGKITGNTAKSGGGGVCVAGNGKFTMSPTASIAENTAAWEGGGVYVYSAGTFNMTGGSITGNEATNSYGGGVCVYGAFTMSNNAGITGNHAKYDRGGGVCVSSLGSITVSGAVNITGNSKGGTKGEGNVYTGSTTDNLYLIASTITIDEGGLTDGAKIGVGLSDSLLSKAFTSGWNTNMNGITPSNYFTSDAEGYAPVLNDDGEVQLTKHTHSWIYAQGSTADTITATCAECPLATGGNTTNGSITIKAPSVSEGQTLTYDGTAKEAMLDKDTGRWQGGDVTITYQVKTGEDTWKALAGNAKPTDAGTYIASITLGNATASVEYTIAKKDPTAADFDFTAPSDLTFSGRAKTATVALENAYYGGGAITVKYFKDGVEKSPIDAGDYTVKIAVAEGANFNATTSELTDSGWEFSIKQKNIGAADVTADSIPDQTYTGNAITPDVTLTYNSMTLEKGADKDYTLSYSDNTDVGQATVTVTGQGNYKGSKVVNFTIAYETKPAGEVFADYNESQWVRTDPVFRTLDGWTVRKTLPVGGDTSVTYTAEGKDVSETVYVKDGSKNIYQVTLKYNYDKTAPTITGVTGNPETWTKENATINFTASDDRSGVQTVAVTCSDSQAVTYTDSSFTADRNGTYTITVTDNAGNVKTETVVVDKIDKTAPVVAFGDLPAVDGANGWYKSNVTVPVTVTEDHLSKWEYSLNGGSNWTEGANSSFTISTDGDYTRKVMIRATDLAGNVTTSSAISVKLDKIAPANCTVTATVGEASYTSGSWTIDNVVFTLTDGDDATSGRTKYQIKIGDTAWADLDGSTYTHTAGTDGSGVTYQFRAVDNAGNEGSATTAIKVLKRQSYTIAFNANGGDSGAMDNLTAYVDVATNLTDNVFTRVGYTFAGWNTAADGSGTAYDNGVSVTNLAAAGETATLYAVWTAKEYNITYEGMAGATYGTNNPAKHTYGTATEVSNPTKTGYTFAGWKVNGGAAVKNLTLAADGYTDHITLTATWTANEYTITYEGIEGATVTVKPGTHTYGTDTSVSDAAKTGYTFAGWKVNGGTAQTGLTLGATGYTDNITLTATWTANEYTITYEGIDGATVTVKPSTHTYGTDTSVSDAAKTGYTFAGWKVNSGAAVKNLTLAADGYINHITLTATWTANTYTITYAGMDGATPGTNHPDTHTYGTTTPISDPTKTGYTFDGWSVNGGAAVKNLTLASDGYTDNITLTATWTANEYTVSFNLNGATGDTPGNITVTYDSTYGTLPAPTRTGYTFAGWYTEASEGTKIESSTSVTITENQTLYAHWTVISTGGGSYTPPTYKVESEVTENTDGSVSFSKSNAKKGDTVTITVTPDRYYKVAGVTVKDKNGKEIAVTDNGDGTFTFKMPDSKVTVEPVFSWDNPFTDVSEEAYYTPAVEWALKNDITDGTGDGTTFSPDADCTRAQMVTFLWRAAGSPEPTTNVCPYTDVDLDSYYGKAALWAAENGITKGTSTTTFSPDMECSRAQMAAFLCRMADGKPVSGSIGFTDVPADAYYAESVQWAAENNITEGTGAGKYSPNTVCTRGQMVTFLYRWLVK